MVFRGTQEGSYRVEFYAEVRRCVYVEGLSERAAARRVGLARETVRKTAALPPAARVSPDAADPVSETGRSVSWGSSIRSCATISIARRSNGTRPRASANGDGRSTRSGAATRSSKTTCARSGWAGRRCSCRSCTRRATPRPTSARRVSQRGANRRGRRRGRTQGPLPGRGSAAQCRRVREGVSGRDDGGVLRGAQRGVP